MRGGSSIRRSLPPKWDLKTGKLLESLSTRHSLHLEMHIYQRTDAKELKNDLKMEQSLNVIRYENPSSAAFPTDRFVHIKCTIRMLQAKCVGQTAQSSGGSAADHEILLSFGHTHPEGANKSGNIYIYIVTFIL